MDARASTQMDGPGDLPESKRLEQEMIAGYVATLEDREELNRDWEIVDSEGWPPDTDPT
jgi:hypothetical protein